MKTMLHNILLNPAFMLWDYGTAAEIAGLPSHGYLANRWKITRLGAATGTITRGATPNTTGVSKWMRNTATLRATVDTVSPEGSVRVAQTIEEAVRWHRGLAVATIIAAGPEGATFDVALGSEVIGTVVTRGSGVYTMASFAAVMGDTTAASGITDFTVFTNPSTTGVYDVAFVQLRLGAAIPGPDQLEVRTVAQERQLCARYARRVGAGLSGPSTASRIAFPVSHPVEMMKGPTWIPAGGQVATVNVDTGATASMDNPSWSSTYASTSGARLITTGWSGLSVGTLMVTTPVIGLLHADY